MARWPLRAVRSPPSEALTTSGPSMPCGRPPTPCSAEPAPLKKPEPPWGQAPRSIRPPGCGRVWRRHRSVWSSVGRGRCPHRPRFGSILGPLLWFWSRNPRLNRSANDCALLEPRFGFLRGVESTLRPPCMGWHTVMAFVAWSPRAAGGSMRPCWPRIWWMKSASPGCPASSGDMLRRPSPMGRSPPPWPRPSAFGWIRCGRWVTSVSCDMSAPTAALLRPLADPLLDLFERFVGNPVSFRFGDVLVLPGEDGQEG